MNSKLAATGFCLALATGTLVASTALASRPSHESRAGGDAEVNSETEREPERDTASITFSPQHLITAVLPYVDVVFWFELTGEFRLVDSWAASVIGGLQKSRLTGSVQHIHIGQFGGKAHWYALGHFNNGMQIGAETLYRAPMAHRDNLDVRRQTDVPILLVGPYLGYKYVNDPGWTVEVQAGANYPVLRDPEAKNEAQYRPTSVRLLVNLGLGWSF